MRPTLAPRRTRAPSKSNGQADAASSSSPSLKAGRLVRMTSNGASPVSKFSACYKAILSGSEKPQPYPEDAERFYFDLFCLTVDQLVLGELIDQLPDKALLDSGSVKVSYAAQG